MYGEILLRYLSDVEQKRFNNLYCELFWVKLVVDAESTDLSSESILRP